MRLRQLITRNLGWKVVSVVLATLVWLSFRSGVPSRIKQGGTVSLPRQEVRILKLADDTRQYRLEPSTVDITLGGNPDVLDRLQIDDLHVFVRAGRGPLPPAKPQPVSVHAPAGITVLAITPPEVTINLDGGLTD